MCIRDRQLVLEKTNNEQFDIVEDSYIGTECTPNETAGEEEEEFFTKDENNAECEMSKEASRQSRIELVCGGPKEGNDQDRWFLLDPENGIPAQTEETVRQRQLERSRRPRGLATEPDKYAEGGRFRQLEKSGDEECEQASLDGSWSPENTEYGRQHLSLIHI